MQCTHIGVSGAESGARWFVFSTLRDAGQLDPAVTDALASDREVVLFDSAGIGRSTGKVPTTVAEMAMHALDFLDARCFISCDILGFSLGGMVAQQILADPDAGYGSLFQFHESFTRQAAAFLASDSPFAPF
jgi:pimeloyl-ACP methyl ester carboxylesterase